MPTAERVPNRLIERVGRSSVERLAYLDNLKTLLIAGIIAAHAIMGYTDFGSWTYQDVREVSLSPIAETIFVVVVASLGGLFLMALFFLISGLFSEDSLARKGASRFVSDRLQRLGIPFAVYTLLIWPVVEWTLHQPILHERSYWVSFMDTDPVLDNGPMWFVGVLLLFSVVLAGSRTRWPPQRSTGELRWRWLFAVSIVVGLATFLVRVELPADSNQPLNAHIWAWPEYIATFGLGVTAARRGWLRPVPDELARRCGVASVTAIACTAAAVLLADPLGLSEEAYIGGWGPPALLASMTEGVLAISGPVWVLAFAERQLDASGPLRRAAARSSYLAFMLQGPVLVALAVMLRPLDLTGDVKALAVAALGVIGSFAIASMLIAHTGLRRVV